MRAVFAARQRGVMANVDDEAAWFAGKPAPTFNVLWCGWVFRGQARSYDGILRCGGGYVAAHENVGAGLPANMDNQ
jgi:hypothetical protein